MYLKLSGIVLRTVKYSDKASISTIYTREYGCVSYMVYGINGKKSNAKPSCFIPLSLIEITAEHQPTKEIQVLKEARIRHNLLNLHINPLKNAIGLFVAELLIKTLKKTEPEERLFDFIENSIKILESGDCDIANFHLIFMIHLASYLGFKPNDEEQNAAYFDLLNGEFKFNKPTHIHFLSPELTPLFAQLLLLSYDSEDTLVMSRNHRNQLLDGLIEYYKLHVPEFFGLNSVNVLHEIFN